MKFNAIIPELSVSNLEQSKQFYLDLLGFQLEYERIPDKFAFLSLGEAQIMLEEINGYWETANLSYPFGRGINFQISVSNLSEIYDRLKHHDVPLFRDLFESRYECNSKILIEHEFLVQDPDGYLLRFSQTV